MSHVSTQSGNRFRIVWGLFPFLCSLAVFLTILLINLNLYAGVVSVGVFSCVVILGGWVSWYLIQKKPRRQLLPMLAVLLANLLAIGIFWGNLPKFTLSQAAQYIMEQEETVTAAPNPDYRVMDTAEPLNLLVDKGYVLRCTHNASGTQTVVFFQPITGEYYEIE